MLVSVSELRKLVRMELQESSQRGEEVTLSDGSPSTFASPEHVRDMQAILAGLLSLKNQHRYGTASRSRFADAASHLRRILTRASAKMANASASVDESEAGPGTTGYGRGAPAHGRYTPGRKAQA